MEAVRPLTLINEPLPQELAGPDERLAAIPCRPGRRCPSALDALDFAGGGVVVKGGGAVVKAAAPAFRAVGLWLLRKLGVKAAARGLGAFSQRTIGNFVLQSRAGLQGRTFVHEIKVLANTSAKEATRGDFAHLAATLTGEARAAGATAVEIRGLSVVNPGILRLQGLAKDLGFTVKEVGHDFITFAKGL
jgi:hypothetical protein